LGFAKNEYFCKKKKILNNVKQLNNNFLLLKTKIFFFTMDLFAGRKLSLGKAKLLEILASIPYRQCEISQYVNPT